MADSEVKLIVSTDATSAVTGMGSARDAMKRMESDSGSLASSMKAHWLAVSAAFAAVGAAAYKMGEYMQLGARAMQVEAAFSEITKGADMTGEALVAAMKKASAGTIEESAIMQKAVKGITQGLSGEDMVKIMEMARVSARTQGVDVQEAY